MRTRAESSWHHPHFRCLSQIGLSNWLPPLLSLNDPKRQVRFCAHEGNAHGTPNLRDLRAHTHVFPYHFRAHNSTAFAIFVRTAEQLPIQGFIAPNFSPEWSSEAKLFSAFSLAGASLAQRCFRFRFPLIELKRSISGAPSVGAYSRKRLRKANRCALRPFCRPIPRHVNCPRKRPVLVRHSRQH
jgi:hypothetical protein